MAFVWTGPFCVNFFLYKFVLLFYFFVCLFFYVISKQRKLVTHVENDVGVAAVEFAVVLLRPVLHFKFLRGKETSTQST